MQVEYREFADNGTCSQWFGIESDFGFAVSTAECGDMGPSGLPAFNRDNVLRSSGYDPASVLGVRQTHSRDIADFYGVPRGNDARAFPATFSSASGAAPPTASPGVPPAPDADSTQDSEGRVISGAPGIAADGILFDRSAQAAGVTVADCLPVLLVAEDTPLSALVHSGFRGTGIVSVALRAMRELAGVEAERVTAVLGPCIAGECYAVPRERAERFRNTFGVACAWHRGDQSYIDMRAANLLLLEAGGVQRVTVMNVCTHCDPRLGSYRRDGANFFRMLAIAGPFRE